MYKVQKRDGKAVDFDISKISNAIRSAFEAQEKPFHPDIIDFLALKVTADYTSKIKDGLISVEDIHRELASRHVIDHKIKQEKMASDAQQ